MPPVANFKEVDPELGVLELVERRRLSDRIRLAPGRRIRFADQHDAAALGEDQGRSASTARMRWAMPIASPTRRMELWLSRVAGYPTAELEVVKRTLRVRDQWPQARVAAAAEESRAIAGAVAQTQAPVLPPRPIRR